jgi:putative lipoprotein
MMTFKRLFTLGMIAMTWLAGHAAFAASTITGTASYRERITLPPAAAVFEATLEDISRSDAPATVLGRTRIESPGNPPIRFSIDFDPAAIDARQRYAVRARITLDGKLMFTTDTVKPVLGPDHVTQVDLLLVRVGAARPSGPPASAVPPQASPASLENTYWKLVSLRGTPVQLTDKQREPHLILQQSNRRMVGSGGCNRLMGGYTHEGARLVFSKAAGTMMACPQGVMGLERALLDTLSQVASWRIDGQQLELLDGQGTVLAAFESRYLK